MTREALEDQGSEGSDFASIEDAVAAMAKGEIIVVVDDEDRENEGDLIMAAEAATPEKVAFFVGSASFTRLNTESETSRGSPTTSHALPVQTRNRPSAATQTIHPVRGTNRIHAPSTQKAMFRSHPAQRPVARQPVSR